ncbi:hypothetical protein TOPH_02538 [Tolypocladium ophioglossoides CBS 100239]|uniref:Uncharacterized protein n=1 Tax=Tolypocladium ophioglossoides (strain CBS 100239) TaxID=1163406 RepID=A0A0L0NF93_TOLOC|nr:hypothetical protein TOPH_02538 [Tolypocladium ophioglossoides CBS 100239]
MPRPEGTVRLDARPWNEPPLVTAPTKLTVGLATAGREARLNTPSALTRRPPRPAVADQGLLAKSQTLSRTRLRPSLEQPTSLASALTTSPSLSSTATAASLSLLEHRKRRGRLVRSTDTGGMLAAVANSSCAAFGSDHGCLANRPCPEVDSVAACPDCDTGPLPLQHHQLRGLVL